MLMQALTFIVRMSHGQQVEWDNGTYGLYDKVNETIATNRGTGEFTGSSTIVGTFDLPAEWKKAASVWTKVALGTVLET